MSNFPLSYKLAWLPRLLRPSLDGAFSPRAPMRGDFLATPPASTVRLAFVGDISAVVGPEPAVVDARLAAMLSGADLVLGNCESPVVERPANRLGLLAGTHHAMHPSYLRGLLAAAGIAPDRLVLSVANNHMLDQGIAGFVETTDALASLDITVVGGAEPLVRLDRAGLTLAIFAFSCWRNAHAADFAGRVTMAEDVARDGWQMFRHADADLMVALPHWDWEFRHFPRPETRGISRKLVDAGAGLVIGGHAHVLQPAEMVDDAFVAYSLGDFVGTAWSRMPWPGRIGAILLVDLSADPATRGQLARYQFVPFMRLRENRRERLVPIDDLDEPLRGKVTGRLVSIFGEDRVGLSRS